MPTTKTAAVPTARRAPARHSKHCQDKGGHRPSQTSCGWSRYVHPNLGVFLLGRRGERPTPQIDGFAPGATAEQRAELDQILAEAEVIAADW